MYNKIKEYFKEMRIKHYVKNLLIFLPIIFSKNIFNGDSLIKCIMAFIAFSLSASAIYIINDIADVEKDRKDEIKKNRPIAKGNIKISNAIILSIVLIIFAIAIMISIQNLKCVILLIIYVIINLLYSFKLKDIPILDVMLLSSMYIIRVMIGGFATDTELSSWLILTIMTLACYLSLGKRRNEILKNKDNGRKVLEYYTKEYLDSFMMLFLTLTITFYALWTININSKPIVYSVFFVIFICMRYNLIIEKNENGNPTDIIFSDKILLVAIIIYAIFIFGAIYIKY